MAGFVFAVHMVNERKKLKYDLHVVADDPAHALRIVRESNRVSSDPKDWQARDAEPFASPVIGFEL